MTMNRGMPSPEVKELRQAQNNNKLPSIPSLPLHAAAGGCMIQQNASNRILPSSSRFEEGNVIRHDRLPSYPGPKASPKGQNTRQASFERGNSMELLEDFPKPPMPLLEDFPKPPTQPKLTAAAATATVDKMATPSPQKTSIRQRKQLPIEEKVFTFPGFTLYQTAKVQYCLGRYSQALDKTAECLSLNKGRDDSPNLAALPAPNADMDATSSIAGNGADINTSMTALDLRSYVVTGVGSSVRTVVQSLKESRQGNHQHHPMLYNSIAIMISQYHSHPCVVQTLLLRGHILAACGPYGSDHDDKNNFPFMFGEAIRHVEMAVAIQRKLGSIADEELAAPLVFLGNMKTRVGRFDEAGMAYKEAISILRNIQSNVKHNPVVTAKTEDAMASLDCAEYLKIITGKIACAVSSWKIAPQATNACTGF